MNKEILGLVGRTGTERAIWRKSLALMYCPNEKNRRRGPFFDYSKRAALESPQRAIELIEIRRVITDKKGNKSRTSITFISAFVEKTFSFLSSWLSPERSDCSPLSDG